MKIYKDATDSMRVKACMEAGQYILYIEKWSKMNKRSDLYSVKKVFTNKEQANCYFSRIKETNPTLKAM